MYRLVNQFADGGDFMWVILFVAMLSLTFILERTYFVVFKSSINTKTFIAELEKLIQNRNIERAIALCNTTNAALAQVLREILKYHSGSGRDMQVAADAKTLEVIPKLEKRTSYLDMLAQIATLLGLLGTISGLMTAFDAVAVANPEDSARLLSEGISIAMLTTMFGLTVAVPTLAAAAWLKDKTRKIVNDIDEYSVKITNLITQMKG
ncbi:MAG TPA: MotA/TolQ/ExbB proton channel family protein [Candidatus Coatesbacteria bacterium]|nr:MotA/TolQ/ExbB proton channel family protein [Candidatus Coatesbacteria bacterium]